MYLKPFVGDLPTLIVKYLKSLSVVVEPLHFE